MGFAGRWLFLIGMFLSPALFGQDLTEEEFLLEEDEELLLFEDIPVVVSSSRQSTPIHLSAAPISIVDGRTLHLSGVTRIEEIFDFAPGVDVLRFDKNRFGFGVRGLHSEIGDRTLGLVDGRPTTGAIWGAPAFHRVPLILEDIDRIEIVRGPSGGAWGANAFHGVINVITKPYAETQGTLASLTLDEYGDRYAQLRYGRSGDGWGYRVTGSYQHAESSDAPLLGTLPPLVGASFGESRDYLRAYKLNTRGERRFDDENTVDFGLGYSYQRLGPYEYLGLPAPVQAGSDDHVRGLRGHVRLEHRVDADTTWYAQYFGTYDDDDRSGLTAWKTDHNLEAQRDWIPSPDHRASVGAVAAVTAFDTEDNAASDLVIEGGATREDWFGLFGVDRWSYSEDLTLEAQLRGDYYSETGLDWSGRLTALYALDAERNHVARLSGARSFRAPRAGYRELGTERFPLPPPIGGNFLTLTPNSNLENERIWALEAGLSSTLAPGVIARADVYWQHYERLIGGLTTADAFGRTTVTVENLGQAQAYGSEFEVGVTRSWGEVLVWYAIHAFDHEDAQASTRAFAPARQKFGLTARVPLPAEFQLWSGFRYSTLTKADPVIGTHNDGHSRWDLTLSRRFLDGQAEVLVGVRDLLDDTDFASQDVIGLAAQENNGRTFFVRGEVSF